MIARDACLMNQQLNNYNQIDEGGHKMDFGEQFKKIRANRELTQEQMASKLNVSRQAISNWENNRNLPDLEMVVKISMTFNISLDQLIIGGNDMNNMTEKLVKDGSMHSNKSKFCGIY